MPLASAIMPSADTIARPSMRSGPAMFAAQLIRVPPNAKGRPQGRPRAIEFPTGLLDVADHARNRTLTDGRQLGFLGEFLVVLRQRGHGAARLHMHDLVAAGLELGEPLRHR